MTWQKPDTSYWNNKFAAYWHDPIDKVLDIRNHEKRAAEYFGIFGEDMPNEPFWKTADTIASGFERGQVPSYSSDSQKNGAVDFAKEPVITHPTSGGDCRLKIVGADLNIDAVYPNVKEFLETHIGKEAGKGDYANEFRGNYDRFTVARMLYSHLVLRFILAEKDIGGLGALWHRLPADSRFPDHSVWQHNALCSAISSCIELGGSVDQTGLMVFSITPVQGYISKARKLRDHWTGSVILSWLAFEGLRWIIENLGPDHILYPSLIDQPFICAYLEDEWKVKNNFKPVLWRNHPNDIASLPNKFLSIIPFNHADEVAVELKTHINKKWQDLSAFSRDLLFDEINPQESEKEYIGDLFSRQTESFWNFQWAAARLAAIDDRQELKSLLDDKNWQNQFKLFDIVEPLMKKKGYNPENTSRGLLYSSSHSLVQAALAAEKSRKTITRRVEPGEKCQMCGEFEVLHSISHAQRSASDYSRHINEFWNKINKEWKSDIDFKENEKLCSICFIKRAVSRAVLRDKGHILSAVFKKTESFPSTTEIALYSYYKRENVTIDGEKRNLAKELHNSPDDKIKRKNLKIRDRYYAILLMDGDYMGKLINGETIASTWEQIMHPCIVERLKGAGFDSDYKDIWRLIFQSDEILKKRLITPAIHAAISEALGDFAIYGVAPIIEKYDGRLIYAGGDDVCAVMPIENVVAAAREIHDYYISIFRVIDNEGKSKAVFKEWLISPGKLSVNLGLGNEISISAGILICHHKESLAQMIEHAHEVLKTKAKKEMERNACAIELRKRHGGSRFFVRKWSDNNSWDAFENIIRLLDGKDRQISSSLMYRLEQMRPGIEAILKHGEKEKGLLEKFVTKQIERSGVKVKKDENHLVKWIAEIIVDHKGEFSPEGLLVAGFLAEVG
ncbi:MAG: type III-B CRISPR-associated protein Cas10/Cmr2 [Thermodesulfobacteriota bacterium]